MKIIHSSYTVSKNGFLTTISHAALLGMFISPLFYGAEKKNLQLFLARVEKCVPESLNSSSSCGSGKHGQLRRICSQGPASPVSANVHVQARRRPSYARVRARGTDIGFSNKPRYCFLFSFLSFFLFLPFFLSFASFLSFLRFLFWPDLAPFFGLCITRLRHPPQTKSGYKKSASFPTR